MSALMDIAEGAIRGVFGYFFDEKEPEYLLEPLEVKPLEALHIATLLQTKLSPNQKTYYCPVNGQFSVVDPTAQRNLIKITYLPYENEHLTTYRSDTIDDTHRRNMTLLWETTTQCKTANGRPAKYFHWLNDVVKVLVDTNQVRLYEFTTSQTRGVFVARAVMAIHQPSILKFLVLEYNCDGISWTLSDTYESEVAYRTEFDDENRLVQIVKHLPQDSHLPLCTVDITWQDDRNNPPQGLTFDPRSTLIPELVIKQLEIRDVYNIQASVVASTKQRRNRFTCRTANNHYLSLTLTH